MGDIQQYDLIVIGSGPAGESAAMQGCKLRKKVAVIEKAPRIGGSSLHTGSVPSKSLRETVVHLELLKLRTHGVALSLKQNVTVDELMYRKEHVIQEQESILERNFTKTGVDLIHGCPVFEPSGFLSTTSPESPLYILNVYTPDDRILRISAPHIVIATGSSPYRPPWAPYDGETVFDSDGILGMKCLPQKLTIIGAGVVGCEYACIFSKLGIRVNLVSADYQILPFLDHEIADRLKERMRDQRIILRFGEEVSGVEKTSQEGICVSLTSGKQLHSSHVLIATGRVANSADLGLDAIGIITGNRGLISVDRETYQTAAPQVYAVGDVIGFPGLTSTGMLQARIAVLHAFGELKNETMPALMPFGLWTIPSVAMIGKTEKELTEAHIPYEVGVANFRELARARIMGEEQGILKLLFDPETLKLLGVHILGTRAPELIHLGHTVMHYQGDIKFFANTVFNYPTLDEAYRIAAFNGINRLSHDL